MKRETRHVPVLLPEVLAALRPRPGSIIVDCTLGLGGHAAAILQRITPGGRLLALDLDPHNIAIARAKLEAVPGGTFEIHATNFAALPTVLATAGLERVDGILADLGVSSPQIDDPARGFSYKRPGPLDMRMDPTRGKPASELVNRLSESQLAEALRELGNEDDAEKVAAAIVARRQTQPITTTEDLVAVVCRARDFTLQRALGAKLHPAARTFQALRILVNRELANLDRLLQVLPDCLRPGGTAAVISFHSGEDRRVKAAFKAGRRDGIYAAISEEIITADAEELELNPRSRSAKLRWARRA